MVETVAQRVYCDEDVDLSVLSEKTVAILGYGIQGRPQALCMRDSGVSVIIGTGDREHFPDHDQAADDGFKVYSISEAVDRSDVIHILIADPAQPAVYRDEICDRLHLGQTLSFRPWV